jgi:hypothetical protein
LFFCQLLMPPPSFHPVDCNNSTPTVELANRLNQLLMVKKLGGKGLIKRYSQYIHVEN